MNTLEDILAATLKAFDMQRDELCNPKRGKKRSTRRIADAYMAYAYVAWLNGHGPTPTGRPCYRTCQGTINAIKSAKIMRDTDANLREKIEQITDTLL